MALKNKKNKYLPAKIMAGMAAVCFTGLCYHCIVHGELESKINEKTRDIISTHAFVEFKEAEVSKLYQAYKDGIISAREFGARTAALTSREVVLKNQDKYMTEESSSEINALIEKDKSNENGILAGAGAAILSVFGSASCYCAESMKKKEYEDYHAMDLC